MKSTELRIGNLVMCKNKTITDFLDTVSLNIHHLTDIVEENKEYQYEPIPLTEEWLVKFGFELQKYDDWTHYWNGSIDLHDFTYDGFVELKHVHQLQNLIHALTGEELTIKS